jgi:hypothetical protein
MKLTLGDDNQPYNHGRRWSMSVVAGSKREFFFDLEEIMIPGSKAESLPLPEIKVSDEKRDNLSNLGVEIKPLEKTKVLTGDSRLVWWVIGILGFIIATVLLWRWKSKSSPK